MTSTDPDNDEATGHELQPLLTDAEQFAVETLLESAIDQSAARSSPIDTILEALSHPGRRYVLTYLLRSEGDVSMSELVDYVVAQSHQSRTDRSFRRKVATALTHTHLPSLADDGFIEYNLERQLVMPTEQLALLAPYLKLAVAQQRKLTEARRPKS